MENYEGSCSNCGNYINYDIDTDEGYECEIICEDCGFGFIIEFDDI